MSAPTPALERHCLVTIGATAKFTQLLQEVLLPDFLNHLTTNGFTHLTLQCGKDLGQVRKDLLALDPRPAIQFSTFAFVDDLVPHMVRCRADPATGRAAGAVLAHAGTGTILDCLRVSAPLVVVPNPTLKDNHQEELAEEIQNQGYAIWGRLGQLVYGLEQLDLLVVESANQFKPHPVSQPKQVDVWSVAGAMMERVGNDLSSPAAELRKEEAAQMAMD
ncbi:family 28 glycosyltransferase [Plectosphaerella plurivora]|uniref:UDP-N-acetylglucosamine transferase subunit ALG13 n=1 Tax=Plectosphaerella plurivora TaxID=936078 RepID=A0A9P8VEL6_9PEZI|nr:family 28 glycosyltransferase [Plectosphaerella plurivora]